MSRFGAGFLRVIAVATLVAMLATPTSTATAATATAAELQLRVMLSGDSITQGFTGGYGSWRSWLWRELVRTGRAPQVDFVGPRNTSAAPGVLLRNDFDPDHAALIGTRLATQATLISDYVTTYQPDVLVTLLGHNDLNHGATPAAVEASMRDYIANARAAKPDIRIVVGEVMDAYFPDARTRRFPDLNTDLNRRYAALVTELGTPESPIVLAKTQYAGWRPLTMTWDGRHPTPTGETRIAQRIGWALYRPEMGVLTQAPRIDATRAWAPNPRLVVSVKSRRLTYDWARDEERFAVHQVQVWRHKVGVVGWVHGGWSSTTRIVSPRLKPGVYAVRLTPRRHWMIGAKSSVVRVRVR